MALVEKPKAAPTAFFRQTARLFAIVVGTVACSVVALGVSAFVLREAETEMPRAKEVTTRASEAAATPAPSVSGDGNTEVPVPLASLIGPLPAPPNTVDIAPIDPFAVAMALLPFVDACFAEVLRLDPSAGGELVAKIVFTPTGEVTSTVPGAPVALAACLEPSLLRINRGELAVFQLATEIAVPLTETVRFALDGLRGQTRVVSASFDVDDTAPRSVP